MEKWKRQKLKSSIFDSPLIVNQTFSQTEFVIGKSGVAYIMHFSFFFFMWCIFNESNVWYLWSLEILGITWWFPFNFTKILQGRHFVVGGPKKLQSFTKYLAFDSGFHKTILSSLLLFSCACYYVDLEDIQWNE